MSRAMLIPAADFALRFALSLKISFISLIGIDAPPRPFSTTSRRWPVLASG